MKALSHSSAARLALAAFVLLAVVGCTGITPIKTLLDDAGRYDGKTVKVAGTVKGGISILNYGTFKIDDGTGSLLVVTKEGGSPREGARVVVEGEFKSAFTVGSEAAAVLVEKQRKAY